MTENEYPTPRWVSNVFDVPEDWLQVPAPDDGAQDRVLALDCEMVCQKFSSSLVTDEILVHHRKRKGADESLHHRLRFWEQTVRSACQAYCTNNRLPYPVLRHHRGEARQCINPADTRSSRCAPGVDHTTHYPTWTFARVRPSGPSPRPRAMHRHVCHLPPSSWPTSQTRASLADEEVGEPRNPDWWGRRSRPRGRRPRMYRSYEAQGQERPWFWRVRCGYGIHLGENGTTECWEWKCEHRWWSRKRSCPYRCR